MFSLIVQECQNYMCNTPPLYCILGDLLFMFLFFSFLLGVIIFIFQSIFKKEAERE